MKTLLHLTTSVTLSLFAPLGFCQTINFENLPDGTPTNDRQEISDQYAVAPFGVSFSIVSPSGQFVRYPLIAKVGGDQTAFIGCGGPDTPLPGQGLGMSFLTDDEQLGSSGSLRVDYTSPVAVASGVLVDVDQGSNWAEQWVIQAFDATGTEVAITVVDASSDLSCTTGAVLNPGNGTASPWTLETAGGSPEISWILLTFTGTDPAGVGLAFDNFSPASACIGDSNNYCSSTQNSTGSACTISYVGTTSVAQNDFELRADGATHGRFGLFFYGPEAEDKPFGDGRLCVAAGSLGLFRLYPPTLTDSQGESSCLLDLSAPPQPQGQITPGSTWYFQFQYRDSQAGNTGFNLSDGLEATFCP